MAVIKTFQKLLKRTTSGGTQEWEIWVEDMPGTNHGVVVTKHGLAGGKKQEQREVYQTGKNPGKKNATTPIEQAVKEAESKWEEKKTRKQYGLTVEESGDVRDESPMLALDYTKQIDNVDWASAYGQPKLDGFRCLAKCRDGKVLLWSREGKAIETMGHIIELLQPVMQEGDTLDGELYVAGMTFSKIASLIKRKQDGSEKVQYNVYDKLSDAPFITRYQEAQARIRRLPRELILPVDTRLITDREQLMEFQAQCLVLGFEGAMLRHGLQAYDAGKRSASLLKVKTFQDAEFLITGAKEGRGSAAGQAVFTCKTEAGHTFDVLAHGSHEAKRAAWLNHKYYIGKQLVVKFQDWTDTEKPVPRFPVAKRFATTV